MTAILVILFIGALFAGIIYLRYLADKGIPKLKEVCLICSGAYNPDEFTRSEINKERMCVKCKLAEELNKREIGE